MLSLSNDPLPSQPRRQPSRRRPATSNGRRRSWRSRCGTTTTSRHATLTRRLARAPHATTVWPFADVAQLPGTTLLAGWLGHMIVTLVTHYSQPGDRILLVSPPTLTPEPTSPGLLRLPGSYVGLAEAVWPILRLGRSAVATTTPPARDEPRTPAVLIGPVRRNESPPERQPRPTQPGSPSTHRHLELNGHPTQFDHQHAERFDLVIAAVSPHNTDWFTKTDWNTVLTQTGTLATITHSDTRNQRLRDPLTPILSTLRSQGRSWLDHIAVLTQSFPEPTASLLSPAASRANHAAVDDQELVSVRRVHHDLLLFNSMPPTSPNTADEAGETSDE